MSNANAIHDACEKAFLELGDADEHTENKFRSADIYFFCGLGMLLMTIILILRDGEDFDWHS